MERKIEDLSRPIPGERNTITLSSGIRFVKIVSRKFVCPKCNTFCGELIPIVDRRVREWMRRRKKGLLDPELQVKVFCFSGCHDHPYWGWKTFNWDSIADKNSISSWPAEWSDEGMKKVEKEAREANARHKGG